MTTSYTRYLRLPLEDFLTVPWHTGFANTVHAIDRVMFRIATGQGVTIWANNTDYEGTDLVISPEDGTFWECLVAHTSATSPTLFSADRTANPSFWIELVGDLLPNEVTNTILADMPPWSIKGRNAGITGDPSDMALATIATEAVAASGQFLLGFLATGEIRKFEMIDVLGGVGGSSPGGVDTNIQFNDGGSFGGDANFNWNKTDERLAIGHTQTLVSVNAFHPAVQMHGVDFNHASFQATEWSNDDLFPGILLGKSRGAAIGTHSAVLLDNRLGGIFFLGSDGAVFRVGAEFNAFADGNWTGSSAPARWSVRPTEALLVMSSLELRPLARVTDTIVPLSDVASVPLDAALGDSFKLIATGDRTIQVPTNAPATGRGHRVIIMHEASGANRTLSLTTGSAGSFRFGSDIMSLTVTLSGTVDYIGCVWNQIDDRWDVVSYVKGF